MKYSKIKSCRLCKSSKLKPIINFGSMALSSKFPSKKVKYKTKTPMIFGICKKCNLTQLLHNYDLKELYNDEYGYRSGINQIMISHLTKITDEVKKIINFKNGDYVLDIASNDATLLKSYKLKKLNYIGIDPTIKKYKKFYTNKITTESKLFSKNNYLRASNNNKAKAITSIAMFYDVQDPNQFISEISNILEKNGIWVMEMFYIPILLKFNAYDSICHEHITYLTYKHIEFLCKKNNLRIFKATLNSMNCGSIRYFICHKNARFKPDNASIKKCKKFEKNLEKIKTYLDFKKRIKKTSNQLNSLIKKINKENQTVHIYGASTKGNVLIQYSKLDKKNIPYAAERNPLKWTKKMPGSNIPIISEAKSRSMNPDYYLVLPWHFKENFIKREKRFLLKGGKLIFPLPKIEIYSKKKFKKKIICFAHLHIIKKMNVLFCINQMREKTQS